MYVISQNPVLVSGYFPVGPLYKSYLVRLGSGTGSAHTVEQDAFPTCIANRLPRVPSCSCPLSECSLNPGLQYGVKHYFEIAASLSPISARRVVDSGHG